MKRRELVTRWIDAVLMWRWTVTLINGLLAVTLLVAAMVARDDGWSTLFNFFISGVMTGYALFDFMRLCFSIRQDKPYELSEADKLRMQHQMEILHERAIAAVRARNPDMEIETTLQPKH